MRRCPWSDVAKAKLQQYLPDSLRHVLAGPARRPLTRRHARVMGLFPSDKMDMMFAWESTIERDYMYLLEADPAVVCFVPQPTRLNLWIEGHKRSHFPDFLVIYADGNIRLAEVKQDAEAALPAMQQLFAAARTACTEHGLEYKETLESKIRKQPNLDIAKAAFRARQLGLPMTAQGVTSLCL